MALIERSNAGFESEPLRAGEQHPVQLQLAIRGDGLFRLDLNVVLEVILQVLAHVGQINSNLDAFFLQMCAWSDAGKHQQWVQWKSTVRL
ncbi:hypothetical protein BamIOP4010DRAFT_3135 [Burkholderia ambifaria IOP40-10]|uniref:Uncharacterized protein n=2 Tax=Burkholderia ambifaria TaxID=152480 RepID=B1FGH5_9BURK|nr:hypothetical protein BamIOP4010DRAFT_3135 [Burkholderia ambifaria IOP40-10]